MIGLSETPDQSVAGALGPNGALWERKTPETLNPMLARPDNHLQPDWPMWRAMPVRTTVNPTFVFLSH